MTECVRVSKSEGMLDCFMVDMRNLDFSQPSGNCVSARVVPLSILYPHEYTFKLFIWNYSYKNPLPYFSGHW